MALELSQLILVSMVKYAITALLSRHEFRPYKQVVSGCVANCRIRSVLGKIRVTDSIAVIAMLNP
jgi:hypothetical protein